MTAAAPPRPAFDVGLLPQEDAAATAALAAEAEELGFDGVWVADSPGVFREMFVTLGACAVRTSTVRLATGVTNPVTRDPAVVAGACATLAEMTGGRMVLGIAVGESAVYNAGRNPASLAELEDAVHVIRELLASGEATNGRRVRRMAWRAPHVPIVVGASGPKTLELAGRIADGVLFQVGAAPSLIAYALEHIRRGAAEAGRDLGEIELCARLACVADDDAERARDAMRSYAAIAANTVVRTVPREAIPEEIRDPLDRLRASYDYASHGTSRGPQSELVTDEILDAVAVVSTPAVVAARIRELVALGVGRFVIPLNVDDKRGLMATLAERVVPALGAPAQSATPPRAEGGA